MSTTSLELKLYSEDEDFLVEGKAEPNRRSQNLIYSVKDTSWFIKVTLIGTIASLCNNGQNEQASKRQRRVLYQVLVRRINYKTLPLLADTVTELILEGDTAVTKHNPEVRLISTLGMIEVLNLLLEYKIQEDPLQIHDKELTHNTEISDRVFLVYHNRLQYILKIVNCPLYKPRDTYYFAGVPNIVQAEEVAVSWNPYIMSSSSNGPLVMTIILLKAHSNRSLQEILLENCVTETALNHFYKAKKTHIDVKTSNIVINSRGNAVCSPEIQDKASLFDLSFQQRRLNDVWAYGKLLSKIISHARDDPFVDSL
ncbi:hypothetical protein BJX70DRAFT_389115 [Aspergillus crustosus]